MTKILTYRALNLKIKKRLIEYAIKKGHGGPMLFLLIVGASLLFFIVKMPLLALLWVFFGLGSSYMIIRDYQKNSKIRKEVISWIVQERLPSKDALNSDLRESVARGLDIFLEIVLKITETVKNKGLGEDISRVLGDADQMIWLQVESAKRIMEFQKVLDLISRNRRSRASPGSITRSEEASRLLGENIETIKKEIAEEESLVSEINQKLETLVTQVSLMDKRASDLVETARFAEETSQALKNLQAIVTARRETAQSVIRRIVPERG